MKILWWKSLTKIYSNHFVMKQLIDTDMNYLNLAFLYQEIFSFRMKFMEIAKGNFRDFISSVKEKSRCQKFKSTNANISRWKWCCECQTISPRVRKASAIYRLTRRSVKWHSVNRRQHKHHSLPQAPRSEARWCPPPKCSPSMQCIRAKIVR